MTHWNNLSDYKQIKREERRLGDKLVTVRQTNSSVVYIESIVKNLEFNAFNESETYFLIEREKMNEPIAVGSMVYVKRNNQLFVLIRLSAGSGTKFVWRMFGCSRDGSEFYPSSWSGDEWVNWAEISELDPQPYTWGQQFD